MSGSIRDEQEHLRYPVGRYEAPATISTEQRAKWLDEIEQLPQRLEEAVAGLNDQQLDTPYREAGWTVRQVVHHVPDSHLNSYQRFRLALTEDVPRIKTYEESRWAELPDARTAPIGVSLSLLRSLHARWMILLRSMGDAEYARAFWHPDKNSEVRLDWMLGLYAWHSRHHVAQIRTLRERKGW